jgi:hypothetical protein
VAELDSLLELLQEKKTAASSGKRIFLYIASFFATKVSVF